MQWNLGSNIGNKMNAEHASIVMNSVWACSRSRCGTAEIAALEFSILETISLGDYHLQSSMHFEGIFTKDISPKNVQKHNGAELECRPGIYLVRQRGIFFLKLL